MDETGGSKHKEGLGGIVIKAWMRQAVNTKKDWWHRHKGVAETDGKHKEGLGGIIIKSWLRQTLNTRTIGVILLDVTENRTLSHGFNAWLNMDV